MVPVVLHLGDIIRMRKPHPCGSDLWEILRVGADFRIKCQGCGHSVMMPRPKVERGIKEIVRSPVGGGANAKPGNSGPA